MIVRAPASSANLGPGFDVLGLALELYADVGLGTPPPGGRVLDAHHPAFRAFGATGGTGPIWLRSPIPMARGLGFSAAVRVAAAGLGVVVRDGADALDTARQELFEVVTGLEGHGDNAAASVYGGMVAVVDRDVLRLRIGQRLRSAVLLAWVPESTTSTDRSRRGLPGSVPRSAAVHNLGRTAQLVIAVERDDVGLLADATNDRLHQEQRLRAVEGAAEALHSGVDAGAWCGWLSGSGPTIALLTDAEHADAVTEALPGTAHVKRLRIDTGGVRVVTATPD